MISTLYAKEKRDYLGPELRPHFILSQYRLEGDAIVAFRGACEVKTDHLVDWEDRLNSDFIRAKEMVHFLAEFFRADLREIVFFQRLFAAQLRAFLEEATGEKWSRSGDDLYWNGKKLTVSIVTQSPVSSLLHFGVNWDSEGAPVEAVGLSKFMNETARDALVERMLEWVQNEWTSVGAACVKVRPVM